MSAASTSTLMQAQPPAAGGPAPERSLTLADIDASCRLPVLKLFASAAFWLVLSSALAVLASVKSHAPGLLSSCPWLGYGRIKPAAVNLFLYGFATQAALGVVVWLVARLSRAELGSRFVVLLGAALWNIAVAVGCVCILAGGSSGFEWLEMPRQVNRLLFVAFVLIGVSALLTFHRRRERELFVTQWYLVGATFLFPWIFSAAGYLLEVNPVRGTMQPVVNAWFTTNLLGLWLTPVGLGVIYYFLPKLSGRPIYSHYLAAFGFWTWVVFPSWSGLTKLIGGPVPAWMISVSVAANAALLVPVLAVAINWHQTLEGNYARAKSEVTGRFIVFGAVAYLVASLLGIAGGFRETAAVTRFTHFVTAQTQLALFGFVAMVLFAGIYYIVPRLTRTEWPKPGWISTHYLLGAAGVVISVIALVIGGLKQGAALNNPGIAFPVLSKGTVPFVGISTLGLILLFVGSLLLLGNLLLLIRASTAEFRANLCAVLCGCDSQKGAAK